MKSVFMLLGLCFGLTVFAQIQPEFEFQLGSSINKVKWMQQTNTGSLVAATDLSLIGIDPKNKKIIWEIKELGSAEEDKFENIPGTPYFMVETAKSLGLGTPQTSIIEAETGRLVFNSKDADMKISGKMPLYEIGAMLIEGKKSKHNFIALIDFATGSERWNKDMGEAKGGVGIGALKRKIQASMNSIFSIAPMVDKNGNLVIVDKDLVTCLSGKDGSEVWKKEFKEKIGDALLTYDRSKLFITYENKVDLLSMDNGTSAYGEKLLKLKGECNGLVPYDANSYVVKHSNGVNIIDAATGQLRWTKESDVSAIDDVRLSDKGIIAIHNGEKETVIYLVNNEGKKVWKFELKESLSIIEPTEKGIIYFTEKRANLLSYEKGDELWKRDIKIRNTPSFAFDKKHNRILVYSDDKLSAFNVADGQMTVLNEEIKLKDYDEEKELARVETRSNGYFISSMQNTALVDFDGKIIYNKNFKEAGFSKGVKTLMKGAGVLAAGYSGYSSLKSLDTRQAVDQSGKPVAGTTELYQNENSAAFRTAVVTGGASNALFQMANQRFTATKRTKDAQFILTKLETTNGLVKVEKDSGKELAKIGFGDKEPSYVVDEVENKLYVIVKDKFIQGYDLSK